jgi:hypothetical protein
MLVIYLIVVTTVQSFFSFSGNTIVEMSLLFLVDTLCNPEKVSYITLNEKYEKV